MSRTRLAVAGAALAVLTAALTFFLWPSEPPPDGATSTAAKAAADRVSDRSAHALHDGDATQEPAPPVEELPQAHCYRGLLELDAAPTIDALVHAAAFAGDDAALSAYVSDRLAELVGNDAAKAEALLDAALAAGGPQAEVLFDGLRQAPAVRQPRIAARLLAAGEDARQPMERRALALTALETQRQLAPELRQRLETLAKDPSADHAGYIATRTLGRVMKESVASGGDPAPYLDALMRVSRGGQEESTRLLALEMPMYADPAVGPAQRQALADTLMTDPEPQLRELAAMSLSLSDDPDAALAAFKAAWSKEREECVRWAIFRYAVRAAGPNALPLVQQFAQADPRFADDYAAMRAQYAQGTVDFERVFAQLPENHMCWGEPGAPHGGEW